MGYLERQAWRAGGSLISLFVVIGMVVLFFAWPIVVFEPKDGAPWTTWHIALATFLELLWLSCLLAFLAYRAARQQAQQQQEAAFRERMSATNTPWLDTGHGHYRHGTCTIKHRSEGAAARCRGTI